MTPASRPCLPLLAGAIGALAGAGFSSALAAATGIEERLSACSPPYADDRARCGTYEVWENREAGSGRRIALQVVVLPARAPQSRPDPIFLQLGGGFPATDAVTAFVASGLRDRDLVFVDLRGLGRSNGLWCELPAAPDLSPYLGDWLALGPIRTCREEVLTRADPTLYSDPASVDDLEEIREWLGYGRINFFGASGGTITAQVYLRRHPQAIRAAALLGVAATDLTPPLGYAADAQAALEGVLADCTADAACRRAFPRVSQQIRELTARLESRPVAVAVENPATGTRQRGILRRHTLALALRLMLYQTETARRIPWVVDRAAGGDFAPLMDFVVPGIRQTLDAVTLGGHLSYLCAMGVDFLAEEDVGPETVGTFLGDYMVRQYQAACAEWPHPRLGAAFQEPVASQVPVLLLSGGLDPSTSPRWADRVAAHLPNSVHLVAPALHHEVGDPACLDRLLLQFFDRATARGLDGECWQEAEPAPFFMPGPSPTGSRH